MPRLAPPVSSGRDFEVAGERLDRRVLVNVLHRDGRNSEPLRISAPNRAISSEWAPRSWKKLSVTEARSISMTSASASAARARSLFAGRRICCSTPTDAALRRGATLLRSALLFDVIGIDRKLFEIAPGPCSRAAFLRSAFATSVGDTSPAPLLARVIGDELGRARLRLVGLTNAWAICGTWVSTASISPSSIR